MHFWKRGAIAHHLRICVLLRERESAAPRFINTTYNKSKIDFPLRNLLAILRIQLLSGYVHKIRQTNSFVSWERTDEGTRGLLQVRRYIVKRLATWIPHNKAEFQAPRPCGKRRQISQFTHHRRISQLHCIFLLSEQLATRLLERKGDRATHLHLPHFQCWTKEGR